MRMRRLAIAAVAVVALTGVSACGSETDSTGSTGGGTTAAPATTAPTAPADELKTAAAQLTTTTAKLKIVMSGGVAMSGVVDAAGKKTELTSDLGQSGTMVVRQLGNDMYVKAGGSLAALVGSKSGKWMHVDISKVSENSALNAKNQDPFAMAKMIDSSGKVTKTGETSYSGTIDLTKSPTFKAPTANAIGEKMKVVPFTAQTDGKGHLSELVIDMNAVVAGSGKMTASYSDFGAPVTVAAPPAADVIPMPAKFLKSMGG
jgi:hypothetical protein